MTEQFNRFIKDNLKLKPGQKIVLAVSGGVDSITMMHLFSRLPFEIAVAHCNFQLRGKESAGDEQFVQKKAAKFNWSYYSKRFQTQLIAKQEGISIQMAARKLRYEWFEELRHLLGFNYIATGHNAGDNTETMLLNILRGTGISGLHGILPVNGAIVRPLLFATREDILAYALKHHLSWRNDSSNDKDDYSRNKIRNKVIPVLQSINPSLHQTFAATAKHISDAGNLLNEFIEQQSTEMVERKGQEIYININQIFKYSNAESLLYFVLKDYGFKNETIQQIAAAAKNPGKTFYSENYKLTTARNQLVISHIDLTANITPEYLLTESDDGLVANTFHISIRKLNLKKNHKYNYSKSPDTACFDADKIQFPLQLRKWKKGDYFYPIGMKGKKKKLSDYFTDEKISLTEKQHIWLMLSGGKICWIAGRRMDEHFKITQQTKKVIEVKFTSDR